MLDLQLKNIITKKAGTWKADNDSFPEIARSADGSPVYVEYVELPTGELMIMEYEINPNDKELMKKVAAFERGEAEDLEATKAILRFNDEEEIEEDEDEAFRKNISKAAEQASSPKNITKEYDKVEDKTSSKTTPKASSKTNNAAESQQNKAYVEKSNTTRHTQKKKKKFNKAFIIVPLCVLLIALLCIIAIPKIRHSEVTPTTEAITTTENSPIDAEPVVVATSTDVASELDAEYVEEVTEEPEIEFNPHCVESTKPENYIASTAISVDGVVLENNADYSPAEEITFGYPDKYTDLEGVITFRGNNFRNDPTYGYANMKDYQFESIWSRQTGSLSYGDDYWSGSGWTGQPLIVKWPDNVKQHMNMYDEAKAKEDLVEVIYACMDGYIYFIDLETGEKTRDTMYLGFTFKGAGALDPRGYPIMYVGAGFDSVQGPARVFIINLLDCTVMHTFGNGDPFTMRGNLSYFDSSALVDAETDTLIYPGENGILYLMHLGTEYDEENGTLSINPEHVTKWHYTGVRNSPGKYWYGMEDSCVIYKGYLFIMDNGANIMCLDLNTLQLVWVQDSLDDSNSTPILSIEDGKPYIYCSTSFRLGWRSSGTATIPIWKLNAETGEVIWQTEYTCYSESGTSGGVQSTMACGRDSLSDYMYVTVAKTVGDYAGTFACISKETGEVMWEHHTSYSWSSPACVYNEDGSGAVLYCASNGNMYLLDGITGEVRSTINLGPGNIEASPAVYNDTVVIGTRGCRIWGVKIK